MQTEANVALPEVLLVPLHLGKKRIGALRRVIAPTGVTSDKNARILTMLHQHHAASCGGSDRAQEDFDAAR